MEKACPFCESTISIQPQIDALAMFTKAPVEPIFNCRLSVLDNCIVLVSEICIHRKVKYPTLAGRFPLLVIALEGEMSSGFGLLSILLDVRCLAFSSPSNGSPQSSNHGCWTGRGHRLIRSTPRLANASSYPGCTVLSKLSSSR